MEIIAIEGVAVAVDVQRTRTAYAELAGKEPPCACAYCRNFRAHGLAIYPESVLEFFARAGIDPNEPAEIIENGQNLPGCHLYSGEHYFFGDVRSTEVPQLDASGSFSFSFGGLSPLAQEVFSQPGAVSFQFFVELPWIIEDAL